MVLPPTVKTTASTTPDANLASMDRSMSNIARLMRDLDLAFNRHHAKITALLMQGQVQQALTTQASFNLYYLRMQSQLQGENRSYATLSNVLNTKHDATKNIVSNIR